MAQSKRTLPLSWSSEVLVSLSNYLLSAISKRRMRLNPPFPSVISSVGLTGALWFPPLCLSTTTTTSSPASLRIRLSPVLASRQGLGLN